MNVSMFIPDLLKEKVNEWRENGYQCEYSILQEILNYNFPEMDGEKIPKYLRLAQLKLLKPIGI